MESSSFLLSCNARGYAIVRINTLLTINSKIDSNLFTKPRLSSKKVWIITLSVTFSVLFYGYSLIAMFPFTFFFFEKKKQKT